MRKSLLAACVVVLAVGLGFVATWLSLCHGFEEHLQGRASAAEVRRLEQTRRAECAWPIAQDDWHARCLELALAWDAGHRLPRLAAHVLRLRAQRDRLPRDDGELRRWLGAEAARLDPDAFALALRYDRPGPDRFRLRVDPATPVPGLLTAEARARIRREDDAPGHHAAAGVIRWTEPHRIEILVPGPAPGLAK